MKIVQLLLKTFSKTEPLIKNYRSTLSRNRSSSIFDVTYTKIRKTMFFLFFEKKKEMLNLQNIYYKFQSKNQKGRRSMIKLLNSHQFLPGHGK